MCFRLEALRDTERWCRWKAGFGKDRGARCTSSWLGVWALVNQGGGDKRGVDGGDVLQLQRCFSSMVTYNSVSHMWFDNLCLKTQHHIGVLAVNGSFMICYQSTFIIHLLPSSNHWEITRRNGILKLEQKMSGTFLQGARTRVGSWRHQRDRKTWCSHRLLWETQKSRLALSALTSPQLI